MQGEQTFGTLCRQQDINQHLYFVKQKRNMDEETTNEVTSIEESKGSNVNKIYIGEVGGVIEARYWKNEEI